MKLLSDFLAWWNRPSAEERILAAMSFTEWRRSLVIIEEADVGIGQFYVIIERLVEEKIIEKRYDRSGAFVRKLKSGKRRPVERAGSYTEWQLSERGWE